jgi:hypothetical protein
MFASSPVVRELRTAILNHVFFSFQLALIRATKPPTVTGSLRIMPKRKRGSEKEEDDKALCTSSSLGFYILCGDNEIVKVSPREAIKIQEACYFFRAVFEHGTRESETRIIEKGDWTQGTTNHLVQLMTTGTARVGGLCEFLELTAAADQVLFGDYRLPLQMEQEKFLEFFAQSSICTFSVSLFKPLLCLYAWKILFQAGVLLWSLEWNRFIFTYGDDQNLNGNSLSSHLINCKHYHVHAKTDIPHALLTITNNLRNRCVENAANNEPESYNLDIPCSFFTESMKKSVFARFEESVHGLSLSDASSFEKIHSAFQDVSWCLTKYNKVRLVVRTNSPETVCRLINGCLQCEDRRGTFGICLDDGSFVVSKSSDDMSRVLEYLSDDESVPNVVNGQFHVTFFGTKNFNVF